jgi:hypothetical protein
MGVYAYTKKMVACSPDNCFGSYGNAHSINRRFCSRTFYLCNILISKSEQQCNRNIYGETVITSLSILSLYVGMSNKNTQRITKRLDKQYAFQLPI